MPPRTADLPWFTWERAHDRLQEVWVNGVLGYGLAYDAAFEVTPQHMSFLDFSTREIRIDPTFFESDLKHMIELPFVWGPHLLTRQAQVSVRVAASLTKHEVAHALYTGRVYARHKFDHVICNILEDERIERTLARYWPEARIDFERMGWLFWMRERSNLPYYGEDQILQAMILFHRWNSEYDPEDKLGLIRVKTWTQPTQDKWSLIKPLTEEAWDAETTEEVMVLSRRIVDILMPPETASTGEGNGRGERTEQQLARAMGKQEGQRWGDDQARSSSEAPDQTPGSGGDKPGAGDGEGTGDDDKKLPGWMQDAGASASAEGDTEGSGGRGRTPMDDEDLSEHSGRVDPSQGKIKAVPYKVRQRKIMGTVRKVQSILVVPNTNTDPVPNATSGRFSARAWARTGGERPLVRREADGLSPEGICVMILIDGSGSMGYAESEHATMHSTANVAMAIERACAAANVPLAGGIAGGHRRLSQSRVDVPRLSGGGSESIPARIHWWKKFDTPAQSDVPRNLIGGLIGDGSDESVSYSLREGAEIMLKRPEKTKIMLTMHDGNPTDESRENAGRTVTALRKRGLIVCGVLLANTDYLRTQYTDPDQYTRYVQRHLDELQENLKIIFGDQPDGLIYMESMDELAVRLARLIARHTRRI